MRVSSLEISLVAQVLVGVLLAPVCFEIEFRGIKKVGSVKLNVNIELKSEEVRSLAKRLAILRCVRKNVAYEEKNPF